MGLSTHADKSGTIVEILVQDGKPVSVDLSNASKARYYNIWLEDVSTPKNDGEKGWNLLVPSNTQNPLCKMS
ncbi:hypothetical protein Acr_22g0006990 [Actinidia rufa]|uniref:Uncharacterized protein n=1 Tax=Actinidia rufa TaxID=165716 RepID=A0A7J0GKN5_9ERIC|nr:hypothetical protein Acr_22g0006990 [Actinidia rufa]